MRTGDRESRALGSRPSLRQPGDPDRRCGWAHGFASPSYDGFAFVEDVEVLTDGTIPPRWNDRIPVPRASPHKPLVAKNVGQKQGPVKLDLRNFAASRQNRDRLSDKKDRQRGQKSGRRGPKRQRAAGLAPAVTP